MKSLLLLAALATTADANVWQHAVTNGSDNHYADTLEKADAAALQANSDSMDSVDARTKQVDAAIKLYKAAAEIEPDAGEPYYRMGLVLYSMYFAECKDDPQAAAKKSPLMPSCDPAAVLTKPWYKARAEQLLAIWAEFEKRSPLDPRITSEFLFERAIVETKLATHDTLEGAARDYEAILAHDELSGNRLVPLALGNLAETYMMLGRLEDAIDMYRRAQRYGVDAGVMYGLAVAYDRNDQGDRANEMIVDLGTDCYHQFERDLKEGRWFFVPTGEEFYYRGLLAEAFGEYENSIAFFNEYLLSKAHPQFQPRAKAHIGEMSAHSNNSVVRLPKN